MSSKSTYETNIKELNHALTSVYLINTLKITKDIMKNQNFHQVKTLIENLHKIQNHCIKSGLNDDHITLINSIGRKLIRVCENTTLKAAVAQSCMVILENFFSLLLHLEPYMESLMQYSLKYTSPQIISPIMVSFAELKLLECLSLCNIGILRAYLSYFKIDTIEYEDSPLKDFGTSSSILKDRSPHAHMKKSTNEDRQTFKIRGDALEKAASILTTIVVHFANIPYLKTQAKLALARVKRLLAFQNKQMSKVWNIDRSPEQILDSDDEDEDKIKKDKEKTEPVFDYRKDSISFIIELLTGELKNTIELCPVPEFSLDFRQIISQEMVETFGLIRPEVAFEYLARYQNAIHMKWFRKILKNSADKTHRYFNMERLNRYAFKSLKIENQNLSNSVIEDFKISEFLYQTIEYSAIKNELLPTNSAYLILQMPPNELFIYIGFMYITQNREAKYYIQKHYLYEKDYKTINRLQESIKMIKKSMQRTVLVSEEDTKAMEAENEQKYHEMLTRFEPFCTFFTSKIDPLINPDTKEENREMKTSQSSDKDKKKQESQTYTSPLKRASSGIESLVLLIDERLGFLPWERLKIFQNIPAISRDFSLNIFAKRLKAINYKPDTNTSVGISKDKISYLAYDFRQADTTKIGQSNVVQVIDAQTILRHAEKYIPGGSIDGISTRDKIPSLGDWQDYLKEKDLLCFYGYPAALEILTPRKIIDTFDIIKTKGFVIIDRINYLKSTIQTFNSLDPDPENVIMTDQPLQTAALYTIMGSAFVISNHWPVKPEECYRAFQSLFRTGGEDLYLAHSLTRLKEPKRVISDSNGNILYKGENDYLLRPEEDDYEDRKRQKSFKEKRLPTGVVEYGEEPVVQTKETIVPKLNIYNDCFVYYGVPVIRFS